MLSAEHGSSFPRVALVGATTRVLRVPVVVRVPVVLLVLAPHIVDAVNLSTLLEGILTPLGHGVDFLLGEFKTHILEVLLELYKLPFAHISDYFKTSFIIALVVEVGVQASELMLDHLELNFPIEEREVPRSLARVKGDQAG